MMRYFNLVCICFLSMFIASCAKKPQQERPPVTLNCFDDYHRMIAVTRVRVEKSKKLQEFDAKIVQLGEKMFIMMPIHRWFIGNSTQTQPDVRSIAKAVSEFIETYDTMSVHLWMCGKSRSFRDELLASERMTLIAWAMKSLSARVLVPHGFGHALHDARLRQMICADGCMVISWDIAINDYE